MSENAKDIDKVPFQYVIEPYPFEPEYTNDLQRLEEERAQRQRERETEPASAEAEEPRANGNGRCQQQTTCYSGHQFTG